MKIGILGQGTIGLANKAYYEKLGHEVHTYDPKYNAHFELLNCDVYLVCTGSNSVMEAVQMLRGRDGLIIIESTIQAGTCRIISSAMDVVHCPQRYWAADPQNRGVKRFRMIGSTSEEVLQKGITFYEANGMRTFRMWPVEVVELGKYAENAYRGLQIAFAEELFMLCEGYGLDFKDVRLSIMTSDHMHWLPEIHQGIGGECLPLAMMWLQTLKTIDAALEADKTFRDYMREKE